MPADSIHPDLFDGQARLRADLVAYLDSLFLHELGELLGALPEPTQVALMHELSQRGPHVGPAARGLAATAAAAGSLREVVAERRAARRPPSPEQLRRWQVEAERVIDQLTGKRLAGALLDRDLRCASGRPAVTRPSVSSARTQRLGGRRGRASGRPRSAADSVRTADRARRRGGPWPCAGACCLSDTTCLTPADRHSAGRS
jgi:hypothetical protein